MCSILAGRVQVDKKAFKTETHLTDRKALMSRFALPAIKGHSVALDSINVHLKFQTEKNITIPARLCQVIREIKFDVTWSYVKRQTAKMKLLPSVFSSLNSRVKIFVFVANSRKHSSIFM